jgi:hypothetical protein
MHETSATVYYKERFECGAALRILLKPCEEVDEIQEVN